MVPDSTVLVPFIVKLAKKLGVDILPKSFKKKDDWFNDVFFSKLEKKIRIHEKNSICVFISLSNFAFC